MHYIWGGALLGELTLVRFYSIHCFLPIIILFAISFHIITLHKKGFSKVFKVSILTDVEYRTLYPNFIFKDLFILILFLSISFYVFIVYPNLFQNLINNILGTLNYTPPKIYPE